MQAQVLLAAYRERNDEDIDTTELDAHLEQCAACREVLARSRIMGERIRSLPSLEPSPDLHARLMAALAAEHTKFMQQSPLAPLPPEFLRPYLHDHLHSSQQRNPLATFSTADTGPLPVIRPARKSRARGTMGHFAIIGIAAVFFMALMMGGITSLLFLAQNRAVPVPSSASVIHPTDVAAASYTAATSYSQVVSAVATRSAIYYSAYSDSSSGGWMIERLDRAVQSVTPLLAAPSQSPLIVLGATDNWLVWLQYDPSKVTLNGSVHVPHRVVRSWSLYAMSLASFGSGGSAAVQPSTPVLLASGTFDENTAPSWVYSPIQGIWFVQSTLLVASIDGSGASHLSSYALNVAARGSVPATSIATAPPGNVITSPTANSDGSQVFWSNEWLTSDGSLHSNIWMQRTVPDPHPMYGRAAQQSSALVMPFLEDGMSFRPLVVNDSLFLLSTAGSALVQGTQQTPGVSVTPSPAGSTFTTTDTTLPSTPWANIGVYPPSLDSQLRGTILMYALDDPTASSPTLISPINAAASLQAGTDFVLWQTDSGYGMYDAITKTPVTVGETLNNALFLSVNGTTAVWTVPSALTTATGAPGPVVTLKVFNWPR